MLLSLSNIFPGIEISEVDLQGLVDKYQKQAPKETRIYGDGAYLAVNAIVLDHNLEEKSKVLFNLFRDFGDELRQKTDYRRGFSTLNIHLQAFGEEQIPDDVSQRIAKAIFPDDRYAITQREDAVKSDVIKNRWFILERTL